MAAFAMTAPLGSVTGSSNSAGGALAERTRSKQQRAYNKVCETHMMPPERIPLPQAEAVLG
jgi:hypothetical protein